MSTPPQGRPTVGGALADRYELRELLGDGAMGTVYRAFDRELERDVAIKAMLPGLAADPEFVDRFRREARALARIRHPNIIGVHDLVRTPEGGLFLILELVRGRSLQSEMRADGPLAWTRCARIGDEVCRALSVAHAAGIVHRDVKPGNILIGDDGATRVADFGIAQLAEGVAMTRVGVLIGTPQYFSPEQAGARAATPRSDIYSLCVVLFEAATGRLPFDSEGGALGFAMQHLNAPVPDPRAVRPEIPAAAAQVIVRGLQKEPGDRFADAEELAGALRATLADPAADAVPAPAPPTRPDPAERDVRRAPRAAVPTTVVSRDAAIDPFDPGQRAPVRRRRRRASVAAAVIAIAAGAGAGLLLGGGGADDVTPAAGRTIDAAGVTTSLPAGWVPAPPEGPPLGLTDARTFSPAEAAGGGSVTVGRAADAGPDLLPVELRERLTTVPGRGQAVDLGGTPALRHTNLRASGIDGSITILSIPTAEGVLTVACVTPASTATDVGGACRQAAGALDVGDERVYALDPDPAYARTLGAALDRLERAREVGLGALTAARLPGPQAVAARRLAAAHATAADTVRGIDAGPARDSATSAIARAADAAAVAFGDMARAAAAGDRPAFDGARRAAASADRGLRAAVGDLAGLGYGRLRA